MNSTILAACIVWLLAATGFIMTTLLLIDQSIAFRPAIGFMVLFGYIMIINVYIIGKPQQ